MFPVIWVEKNFKNFTYESPDGKPQDFLEDYISRLWLLLFKGNVPQVNKRLTVKRNMNLNFPSPWERIVVRLFLT